MNRTLKFLLIICIMLFFIGFSNNIYIYATETEETQNQSSSEDFSNTSSNENNTSSENTIINDTPDGSLSTLSPSSVTSVSTVNSYEQANLDLNNILCIILIAIGVLLILFAIAILIRLKK